MSDKQRSTLDILSSSIGKMSDYELGYFAGRAEEISKRNPKSCADHKSKDEAKEG